MERTCHLYPILNLRQKSIQKIYFGFSCSSN